MGLFRFPSAALNNCMHNKQHVYYRTSASVFCVTISYTLLKFKQRIYKLRSSQVLKNIVFSLSCIERGKEKWYSAASVHKWTRETNESLWVIGAFATFDIRHTFPHCPHFTWLRFLISTLKMWTLNTLPA